MQNIEQASLLFKPDFKEAAKRWEAFCNGDIIDRPIVTVTAPKKGFESYAQSMCGYRDLMFGDLNQNIDKAIMNAEATYYGGEAIPGFFPSIGPDEAAFFCGAETGWSKDSAETNWSMPYVKKWEDALPFKIDQNNPCWKRSMEIFRMCAKKMAGKMLFSSIDLHTNMDLLSAIRGPENLLYDLVDQPEMIDKAMKSARVVFHQLWESMRTAGQMDELGYIAYPCSLYSKYGAAILQCDFSYMISPEMFRRWILPALQEEADIVKNAIYHWDGPGAIRHADALFSIKGIHAFGYVPEIGKTHKDYIELYKHVQSNGKAVAIGGTPEELKYFHKELRPEKAMYGCHANSQSEADELIEWFVRNT